MFVDLRTEIYKIGATVSGSSGGFFFNEASDEATYPLTIYYLIDDLYSREDTQIRQDVIPIQFSLFDRRLTTSGNKISSTILERTAEELITKFDNGFLNVSGYTNVDMKRIYTRPATITDDGNFWNIVIRYELILNR